MPSINESDTPLQAHHTLDAIGKLCPWPLMLTKQALQNIATGEVLCVIADDPLSELDIRSLCERDGHALLAIATEADVLRMWIAKVG